MSKQSLETLRKYFPTGTAEGERQILAKAFVELEEFPDIIAPPPGSPRILIGKKGSGKSAIIDFSVNMFEKGQVHALLLKPKDLTYKGVQDSAPVGELTQAAEEILARAIAVKLGRAMAGKYAKSSDKPLYDEAIAAGAGEEDSISMLARVLPKLAKPFSPVDLSSIAPGHSKQALSKIRTAIANNLANTNGGFYLFIDDTDQVASPSHPGHLNRIWGFLLAARELTSLIPQLRCVISFREEVWRRLTHDRAGQRDQTDHFSSLLYYLNPTREHIERILSRRVDLAALECSGSSKNAWQQFFDGQSPRMPYSTERSSWPDLIVGRSRERPRDAVQLVDALAGRAIGRKVGLVDEKTFEVEMKDFSKQRVTFLTQETEDECPQMEAILRAFADLEYDYGSFKATTECVRKFLSHLGSGFSITLFGKPMKLNVEDDLLALWRYLFDVGVLNARISDTRQKDYFRHVNPSTDPRLVTKARWNDMQSAVWEINTAYRDFLILIQDEKRAKIGLPPSHRKSHRR